jgi:serine/threonine protein phosphatase PrpC
MPGLRFVSHGLTDRGLVRPRNEDAFLDRPDIGLWAVADGMGGHQAGDYASNAIVAALGEIKFRTDLEDFIDEIKKRLSIVDFQLRGQAAGLGEGAVIASTIVALLTYGEEFAGVWAGDSRLYQWRAGELRQLSTDHSRTQELIDAGLLTAAAAAVHPEAHIVTQAIGGAKLRFGTKVGTTRPGDRFLLCSDGLTNMVADAEIATEIAATAPQHAAERLRDLVLARGAVDNVTIVIATAEAA